MAVDSEQDAAGPGVSASTDGIRLLAHSAFVGMCAAVAAGWHLFFRARDVVEDGLYRTNIIFRASGVDGKATVLVVRTELTGSMRIEWAKHYLFGRGRHPKLFQHDHDFDRRIVVKAMSDEIRHAVRTGPEVTRRLLALADQVANAIECRLGPDGVLVFHFAGVLTRSQALAHKEFLDAEVRELCTAIRLAAAAPAAF